MDQYLTTYNRDYAWPPAKSFAIPGGPHGTAKPKDFDCPCESHPRKEIIKRFTKDSTGDSSDWSRQGPLGRLLDPKLYPAKTGPSPENKSTKFDQPGTFINKLEEKYPNLYGVLQSAPTCEMIKRVDDNRMKTTYQIDYSDKAAARMNDEQLQSCVPVKAPVDVDCRPHLPPPPPLDRKYYGKCNKKDDIIPETHLPPLETEYGDAISKVAEAIMRNKIHRNKKAVPALARL